MMPARIEDYALIGDCQTAALVSRDGSIDWLCLPHFDSGACFAALLGTPDNGHWRIAPRQPVRAVRRRYRGDTLVLETEIETESGRFALIDFMPPRGQAPDVVRFVEGRAGSVPLRMELVIRFDYGAVVPWVRHEDGGIVAVAGPDMVHLQSDVPTRGEDFRTVADFTIEAGRRVSLVLTWHPSHERVPRPLVADEELRATERWWRDWSSTCNYNGAWRDAVVRSLITLKALTFTPTGGMVAAPTTSLPEQSGGVRIWDYRFCWIRDATFTLLAMMNAGYADEARAWRDWLVRAAAGKPEQVQIVYGIRGERRLAELELDWLEGYEGARPVRIGNDAWRQHQLDVYGEAIDATYQARRLGIEPADADCRLERAFLRFLETDWQRPDCGIWEVRGPPRHFTHSKVMAWVAFDRAVKAVERFGLEGPAERWRALRDQVHEAVCRHGFSARLNSFVQSFDDELLDASLLLMPEVGFLPPTDPRIVGTVSAIERHLVRAGLVMRYNTRETDDGLPPGEGAFLPCTFWLADNLALMGRREEAEAIFERVMALRNDVGLLSESYDLRARRMLGNFPQALTHIGLIDTAYNLAAEHVGPVEQRSGD
jgi:GH15 family glucan-1,4-alpha-glucosidase